MNDPGKGGGKKTWTITTEEENIEKIQTIANLLLILLS